MRTDILCITHAKDIDFCEAMMASYDKFATGFGAIKVVVPTKDFQIFCDILPGNVNLARYDEVEGKGMLHHEAMICNGDIWCPEADQILHMDADCLFKQPVTPESYMRNGRPVLLAEPFEDFRESYPTRYGWKACVRDATGIDPSFETMVRHPHLHVRSVYQKTRELVEGRHKIRFEDYVLSCENTFPQTFAEFPTLGAVAMEFFIDQYEVDVFSGNIPPDRGLVEFWSHGGIDYISDRDHKYLVDGKETTSLGKTPRQVFKDLCLSIKP